MKNYKEKLAALKRLGVMSGADYNSSGRKSAITKKWNEWKGVAYNPAAFHKATVSRETAALLKASGFKVNASRRAFIPLGEYSSAKIAKGQIVFEGKNFRETVPLMRPEKVGDYLQRKITRKKPDELITARIGDSSPFKTKFLDEKDLNKYLKDFSAKNPGAARYVSIVRMKRAKK